MLDRTPANRSFLQVAAVAVLVFIGAVSVVLSSSPAGILGTAMSTVVALAWLTACCSLAGLALAASRR